MNKIQLELPYPPTINHYYGRTRTGQLFIKPKGTHFRDCVSYSTYKVKTFAKKRLSVEVIVYPPDKRIRDLDNITKALLDSLQNAGLFENDSQIDRLLIERKSVVKGGWIIVTIEPLN
jgi:crossover junction endodeoxyribonuclease RusA